MTMYRRDPEVVVCYKLGWVSIGSASTPPQHWDMAAIRASSGSLLGSVMIDVLVLRLCTDFNSTTTNTIHHLTRQEDGVIDPKAF